VHSKPMNCAYEDPKRYGGKGVLKAVEAVIDVLSEAIEGLDASEQRAIDTALIEADGTENKSKLGANSILGVSLAVAKAAALSADLPLFRYLGGPNAHVLPVPMMNVINGGPTPTPTLTSKNSWFCRLEPSHTAKDSDGVQTYHALKARTEVQGFATGLGDGGGFAPNLANESSRTRPAHGRHCSGRLHTRQGHRTWS